MVLGISSGTILPSNVGEKVPEEWKMSQVLHPVSLGVQEGLVGLEGPC